MASKQLAASGLGDLLALLYPHPLYDGSLAETCQGKRLSLSNWSRAFSAKASISKKTADTALTATVEAIVEAVAAGDKVTLVGFGSFESRHRQAREGRNPKTGDTMKIPATNVPAFPAGKLFKEKVSSSKQGKKSK